MIERIFQNVPEADIDKADQHEFLVGLGWALGTTWPELLRSKRVLIISEAGAGKTHECREQARRLWERGEPAFLVELASLAHKPLRELLGHDEEMRLDAWRVSQSDTATFFLDSLDELNLSLGSFGQALKNLKKSIDGKLGQARIIITTRPIPIDENLVREILPVPESPSADLQEESFANLAMRRSPSKPSRLHGDPAPDWRRVALVPLSEVQIGEFARIQGIEKPEDLLAELKRRDALKFARRPQDLIELCADWKTHGRIRAHRDQVSENVRVKLLPRDDRREPAELSPEKALEGASRLALALLVTRRMTIRHSAAADVAPQEAALEPSIILSDWKPDERKALLERPLFTFASYGRVRFHHRSVTEFLAAQRLQELCRRRMSTRALKRLLFAETRGRTIVRPSLRPVAGWLALTERGVFELLRDREPAVLLNEGDPESLTLDQRAQILSAYVQRHGTGGWRELTAPPIQIHRFASPELAEEIRSLWERGVENSEVREILLDVMAEGRIVECADIAHQVAWSTEASGRERITALDVLVAVEDRRLRDIAQAMAAADPRWPDSLTRSAAVRMFPRFLPVGQLCQILVWVKAQQNTVADLDWHLARLIDQFEFDTSTLEALRDGLVELLSEGLRWQEGWPHIINDRPHLSSTLAATCLRGLATSSNDSWLQASVLALRIPDCEHGSDESRTALKAHLKNLSADDNARLFWVADALLQSLHAVDDPWDRLYELALHDGSVELRPDRDMPWVAQALGDTSRASGDRALLLEAAMQLSPSRESWAEHLIGLKPLVADQPDLLAVIDKRLDPPQQDQEWLALQKKRAQEQQDDEREEAENTASWIAFWQEVADRPDQAFSPGRSWQTAYDLWHVMLRKSDYSQSSGWNRRLIEDHFDKATADRLRRTLMDIWRQERPTLPSERPASERGSFFERWLLGLAALYAEAEDSAWATRLNDQEASLAARYAPLELNRLPAWMEELVASHPAAADATLGEELSWELRQPAGQHGHSMLLQSIHHAPTAVSAVFLPRLLAWLDQGGDLVDDEDGRAAAERARQVIGALIEHGGPEVYAHLRTLALQRLRDDLPEEIALVWLPALLRLDPALGVDALDERLRTVEPAERSLAVTCLGVVFGDRGHQADLRDGSFTPDLLLRLLRLAYRHVRPQDDARHEDAYSSDARDHAERARRDLRSALLAAKGEAGWSAKQEMASDPLFADLKDRILAVADENWAQEIDSIILDEWQAVALDRAYEAPVTTNEALYALVKDRLADLEDLLRSDASPREAWAAITQERVMRRAIASQLSHAANGLYTVDQEPVTGEENRTDIRLRSRASNHEAVIELKLAESEKGWSARDLRDAIGSQLVDRYLITEHRSSGCLLVTLAKDRYWEHPDSGASIGLSELHRLLCDEAERVMDSKGRTVAVAVHVLDLRKPSSGGRP